MTPSIFIAGPRYGFLTTSQTEASLVNLAAWLSEQGCYDGFFNGSHPDIIEWRNLALTLWYDHRPQSSHLLMVDYDMSFNFDVVGKLINANKPVAGSVYIKKGGEGFVGSFIDTQNPVGGMVPMRGIGAGIMLIRRDAVAAIIGEGLVDVETIPDEDRSLNAWARHYGVTRILHAFDKVVGDQGKILSEDLSFCHRVRQAGLEVWGDVESVVGHVGMHEWRGRAFSEPDASVAPSVALPAEAMPTRKLAVVDVGASPIDGDPIYRSLLDAGLCTVVGFEPQRDELRALLGSAKDNETYLPDVIGDGETHTLYRCFAPGMTSLLKPDKKRLGMFFNFDGLARIIGMDTVKTATLDKAIGSKPVDFLKIDVQGAELMVLQGAEDVLKRCIAVQVEVSFVPLYEGQPALAQIDWHLRQRGFIPHGFSGIKTWPLAGYDDKDQAPTQLLEADMIYVRDYADEKRWTDEDWRRLAVLAHHVFQSPDLTRLALDRAGKMAEAA